MAQNDCRGLEHGILHWLPPKYERIIPDNEPKEQFGEGVLQPRRHWIKSPPSTGSHPQRRSQSNWAPSSPGMWPVFLGSGPKCCGTGVFLPRAAGIDFRPTNGAKSAVELIDENLGKKKKKKGWCSQDIFLPKEWAY